MKAPYGYKSAIREVDPATGVNGVGVLLSCDQKLDSFASYFMMQVL
jgi:hypothetical protein